MTDREEIQSKGDTASSVTAFERWVASLEDRHLAGLRFAEVSRALRALSSLYVERRRHVGEGDALRGAGKRAAFALFYGPLHYLLVERVAAELGASERAQTLVDLGCGTGAAGAAWAGVSKTPITILGVDRHPWAVDEAARTYLEFGLSARTRCADITKTPLPDQRTDIVAAFALNELSEPAREAMLARLLDRARRGDRVLIVEPLAGSAAPWWPACAERVCRAGGRSDEWRLRIELPAIVHKLDRAAGLDHRELTGRTLFLPGDRSRGSASASSRASR